MVRVGTCISLLHAFACASGEERNQGQKSDIESEEHDLICGNQPEVEGYSATEKGNTKASDLVEQ